MRDGVLALRFVLADLEPQPVVRVAPDRRIDGSAVLGDVAPDQCPVTTLDGVVEELAGQVDLGGVGLGHDQQAGSVLVDAVDQQAHPFVVVFRIGRAAQVPGQRVDQRAAVVAVAGMDHQAGGLVDHQEVVVLIDNVERNRLGLDLDAAPLVGHHEGDHVERLDLVVGLDHLVVHADVTGLDGQLHAVARGVLHMVRKVFVDAQQRLPAVDDHAEMLEHFLLLVFGEEVVPQLVFRIVAHRAAILAWLVVSLRWMVVPILVGAPGW